MSSTSSISVHFTCFQFTYILYATGYKPSPRVPPVQLDFIGHKLTSTQEELLICLEVQLGVLGSEKLLGVHYVKGFPRP